MLRRRSIFEQLESRWVMDATYFNLAAGNLVQDWSNPALLSTANVWADVPSIEGYASDLTLAAGADPQTLLTPEPTPALNVAVDQTNPSTFSASGVAEFAIPDPTIALLASESTDAPYLMIRLNALGRTNIVVSFTARDLDDSDDNAVQPIAVHYRVGETGNWTNLPDGYIPDATTAGTATQRTTRSVTLPAAAENQPQVQVRILTTNAVGADECVGIDDITVTSSPAVANTLPTISDIADHSTRSYEPTPALAFTVGDAETLAANLTVVATSSNQAVIPDENLTLAGSGANRTIVARPAAATGSATITITVTDGNGATATDTFTLTVTAAPTLDIGNVVGSPGETIRIPIHLNTNGVSPIGIIAVDLLVLYDTNVLLLHPTAAVSPATQNWEVSSNANDPGKLSILQFSIFPTFSIDAPICFIEATIKPTAPLGLSPLNLVRTGVVNGSQANTWINEDSILLGPTPTSASNDPISDGVVEVRGPAQSPVNTAPAGPILGWEDSELTFDGANALRVSDADAGTDHLTTTLSVPSAAVGTFAATSGGGTAIVTLSNGGATVTIVGPLSQINLALETVAFRPAENRNTQADGATTITMVTSDGATPPDIDTFDISLAERNDAPLAVADTLPNVNEDSPALVISVATLLLNDHQGPPNESSQTLTVTAVSQPVGGSVALVGNNVVFTPTGNYHGPASFAYTMTDDGTTGGIADPLIGQGTVTFTMAPVNDPPTGITLSRSQVFANIAGAWIGEIQVTDLDDSSHDITIVDNRFEARDGHLYLRAGVALDVATLNVSLSITARDAGGLQHTQSFSLAVETPPPGLWEYAFQWKPRPLDVNVDGVITPLDALLVINSLNASGSRDLPTLPGGTVPPMFFDTSADGAVNPLDALLIINHLNATGAGQSEFTHVADTRSTSSADHGDPPDDASRLWLAYLAYAVWENARDQTLSGERDSPT